jgi:hypothetical protein
MENAWDRLQGEPSLWFGRFDLYRMQGPTRTLRGTYVAEAKASNRKPGVSLPHSWHSAAVRWKWKARAEAFDAQQRQDVRAEHAQAVREMNQRHIDQAQRLQEAALERLKKLNPDDLTPGQLLDFLMEAAKLERAALAGEPPMVETEHGPEQRSFTYEDRRTFILQILSDLGAPIDQTSFGGLAIPPGRTLPSPGNVVHALGHEA